jgi:hypothetical protein
MLLKRILIQLRRHHQVIRMFNHRATTQVKRQDLATQVKRQGQVTQVKRPFQAIIRVRQHHLPRMCRRYHLLSKVRPRPRIHPHSTLCRNLAHRHLELNTQVHQKRPLLEPLVRRRTFSLRQVQQQRAQLLHTPVEAIQVQLLAVLSEE